MLNFKKQSSNNIIFISFKNVKIILLMQSPSQIRNNIRYVLYLSIVTILRVIVSELMNHYCSNRPELLTTYLMFCGEIFFGIVFHISNNDFSPKFMSSLLANDKNKKDSEFKIILYIVIGAFFDLVYFVALNYIIPLTNKDEFENSYLEIRLKPIQIIFASIICYVFMKIAIYRHHTFSLILIILSLVGVSLTEIFYSNEYKIEVLEILIILIIIFIIKSIEDCLEKYLMDFNFCSENKVLFIQGISGIIFTLCLNILIKFILKSDSSDSKEDGNIFILIILSILYFVLSGLLNAYRLTVVMKLSPMNRTTSDAFVDAFIIIYSMIFKDKKNYDIYWKIINIISTFIITFSCLVYNEILVLRCCGLDKNTFRGIADRANDEN